MIELQPNCRYEMPAAFGPSSYPDVSDYDAVRFLSIPFVTEREAVAALVPRFFEVPADPVVTVSSLNLKGVDWMAGRGYNIVNVTVGVAHAGAGDAVRGQYTIAVWETDANAIVAGREFLGIPKLFGAIPDLRDADGACSFTCHEYDGLLVTGRARDLRPVEGERLTRLRSAMSTSINFGWKYVPCLNGPADADYAVQHIQVNELVRGWSGRGEIAWGMPSRQESPISARIVEALRALPIRSYMPAFMGDTRSRLLRAKTRRLPE
jgi:acetoacetate decarboxylase